MTFNSPDSFVSLLELHALALNDGVFFPSVIAIL